MKEIGVFEAKLADYYQGPSTMTLADYVEYLRPEVLEVVFADTVGNLPKYNDCIKHIAEYVGVSVEELGKLLTLPEFRP